MQRIIFSRQDLMDRWNCGLNTVIRKEQDGLLKPCRAGAGVQYPAKQVYRLEGLTDKELNATPFENRRLKIENHKLQEENGKLRATLQRMSVIANEFTLDEIDRQVHVNEG